LLKARQASPWVKAGSISGTLVIYLNICRVNSAQTKKETPKTKGFPQKTQNQLIFVSRAFVLRSTLLRVVVEDPCDSPEEDWPDDRPEGGHVIVVQDWLETGKSNPTDQDDQHDRHNNVRPQTTLEDDEWPFQVRPTLEEWEGPNQEQVREGR